MIQGLLSWLPFYPEGTYIRGIRGGAFIAAAYRNEGSNMRLLFRIPWGCDRVRETEDFDTGDLILEHAVPCIYLRFRWRSPLRVGRRMYFTRGRMWHRIELLKVLQRMEDRQ